MQRRIISIAIGILMAITCCHAQARYNDVKQLYGVYYIYDYQAFEKPDVPRGYAPVSISHYGRHGARFQDSEEAYTNVLEPLVKARNDDALTEFGKSICDRTEAFYALCKDHRGELTHVGWDQQRKLASLMYKAYPSLFSKKAEVTACASFSQRCMMSMSAFCVGLKEVVPSVNLYAVTSRTLLDEANPSDKQNVNYVKVEAAPSPWGMSYDEFFKTRVSHDDAMAILLRIFKDEEYIRQNIPSTRHYCQTVYNMVAGMHCVGDDIVIDDLFTEAELIKFYDAINYGFYEWGPQKKEQHKPVLKSMVAHAEEDIFSGRPCVRLRFGHDTILLGLLTLLDINGLGYTPADAADLSKTWNCFNTPMAANFELVFYKNKKDDVLVLPLLNGKIVSIGRIPSEKKVGDLYTWNDIKALIESL